jgi:nitrate/TMAO reductase-like tetraheme cytochrome c subunit
LKHRLLLILLIIPLSVSAQISPGDLTRAHANLEGLSNCTSCHEIGERVKNFKCLNCHTEVNELIRNKRGYHSTSEVTSKNCADCHSEHHGRNFRIVNFNPEKFDHSKTTFDLTGRHRNIKCKDCHNKMNILDAEALKKNADWMGLSTNCISCHIDYHQGTLGRDCSSCHNTAAFKPSLFDHNKSMFKLTGAHITTACIKCHPVSTKEGKEFQKFKGIQFSSCENCHKDIHGGRLGKDCKSCHSTNSFRSINQNNFDHSKTDFPLLGRHITVSCNSCHKTNFSIRLEHDKCYDCHTDYHQGEFISGSSIRDCSHCHNEQGFTPSLFTIDQHLRTDLPLTGAHLAVPCAACHKINEKWTFRKTGRECIDCHKNIHGEELNIRFTSDQGCRSCHETSSWHTISFDHNNTEFPLEGRHKSVTCRSCHFKDNDVTKQRFTALNKYCTECHTDVHVKQFGYGSSEECSRCHTFDNWKPDKFDHNQTRFSLEGAHSKLKCSECHKTVSAAAGTFIKYKLEDFRCASCHS